MDHGRSEGEARSEDEARSAGGARPGGEARVGGGSSDSGPAGGTRALLELSAALGEGDAAAVDAALAAAGEQVAGDAGDRRAARKPKGHAAEPGRPPTGDGELLKAIELEEALLQAYLFVGFPPVLRAMAAWRARRGAEAAGPPPRPVGPADGSGASPTFDPGGSSETAREARTDREVWRRRGEALCRRVYGSAYQKLRARVRRLHPALDRWMIDEGYGKVLSRPGLDPVRRELCVVALLAAAGHLPQLHSHLRGALRVGARPEEVTAALEIGLGRAASVEDAAAARRLWGEVRRRGSGGTD